MADAEISTISNSFNLGVHIKRISNIARVGQTHQKSSQKWNVVSCPIELAVKMLVMFLFKCQVFDETKILSQFSKLLVTPR
jgi:hypothetical protein